MSEWKEVLGNKTVAYLEKELARQKTLAKEDLSGVSRRHACDIQQAG